MDAMDASEYLWQAPEDAAAAARQGADAAQRLTDVTTRLRRVERDVQRGAPFDEHEFARLVDAFCAEVTQARARARARAQARAQAQQCGPHPVAGTSPRPTRGDETPHDPPAPPAAWTPRLEFARWLVQHGRLSDALPELPFTPSPALLFLRWQVAQGTFNEGTGGMA